MVPYNEPGDRAFWCISGKCLNPGCSPGRRPGARVQAGFYPAPSCPLLSVRLAGPRLIFVPPVHFSTIPVPQQLPFCVPTPPTDVGSRSRDRDGRGRCRQMWRVSSTPRPTQSAVSGAISHAPGPTRPAVAALPPCLQRRSAGHDNQNGSPSHAMTITLPPGVPPLPAHTPTGQDAPGWWPSAGANRLGRQVGRFQMRAHHGRSTVSSPTPVGESVPASGVQNLGEASVGAKPRSDK